MFQKTLTSSLLAAMLAAVSSASAATLTYLRFEDGTNQGLSTGVGTINLTRGSTTTSRRL